MKLKSNHIIAKVVHLFLLIVIFSAFSSVVCSQWVLQQSNTSEHFLNIRFLNKYTGWVSGTNGTIVKTTNGGLNWVVQITNLQAKDFYGLCIVDSNIVYAAGLFDTFIKTTNGGTNWQILKNEPVPAIHSYWSTFFIDSLKGWLCGSSNTIFKTTNGGLTLDSVFVPSGFMYDIYFRNETEGLACGQTAAFYRTTNGGLNWYEINVPVANQSADFRKFSFINYSTGYIIGSQNNKLYKTTDFGITWDSVSRIVGMDESYRIFFLNEYTGFSCGSYTKLFKSTNGGYNWTQENTSQFEPGYLAGIHFYDHNTGWVVGTIGKILYTETGGSPILSSFSNENDVKSFSLEQNYPNPFNPVTKIRFNIQNKCYVRLEVYDLLGKEVQSIVKRELRPGMHEYVFDGTSLGTGIYFYKIYINSISGNSVVYSETRKMLLLK